MINLTDYLNTLERLDLIVPAKSESDIEYGFRHVFTQESVYRSLLRSDRRRLHLQVGEILEEKLAGHHDGETALLLAYHFEQGNDKERALKYLQRAAEDACKSYANQEARALYERALALIAYDSYSNRWEVLAQLEEILDRLGERDQQANVLTQMQTLAEIMLDKERLAVTHNRRAVYFDKISEYQAAFEAAEVGLRVARHTGNEHLQAQSLNALALAAWRRFDYQEVQKWAMQALEVLVVVGDPTNRISSLFHLGKASYRLGQYDAALHYIQAARELTHDTGNLGNEATSHLILGWIYQRLGHYQPAQEQFEAMLKIRRIIGDRYGEATALSHLGWLAYDQQTPEDGLDYCRQALDMSQAISDRENEAYALSGMGLNHELLNNMDTAAANYQAAWKLHNEIGATTLAIFDQAGLARIALAQGDLDAAQTYIGPVTNWVKSGNAQKFWDPWIIYLSGYQISAALNDTGAARAILDEAHTVLHQRAEKISDEKLRHGFLKEVQVNQALEQAWHALPRDG